MLVNCHKAYVRSTYVYIAYACVLFATIYNSASSTTIIQSAVDELSCCTDGIFTHVTLILQYGLADHTIIQVQTYTYCIISHAVKTRLKILKLESY